MKLNLAKNVTIQVGGQIAITALQSQKAVTV